jgi:hypothetical protein
VRSAHWRMGRAQYAIVVYPCNRRWNTIAGETEELERCTLQSLTRQIVTHGVLDVTGSPVSGAIMGIMIIVTGNLKGYCTSGLCKTCLSSSSFTWFHPTCEVLSIQSLGLRPCILTNEFSPVRPEKSILTISQVLTKSHIVVVFIKSLHYLLASSEDYCLAPPGRRLGMISHLKI